MAMLSVKYKTPKKLHISQGPGWYSYTILFGLLSVSFWAAIYQSNEHTTKAVYILVSLLLGLTCMDDWEDWVLDRDAGLCTVTCSNWYGRLRSQAKESSTRQAKLADVIAAFVKCDKGLTLVLRSGETISSTRERWKRIKKKSSAFKKLQNVAEEITCFLQLDHIEDGVRLTGSRSLTELLCNGLDYFDSSSDPIPVSMISARQEFENIVF